MDPILSLVDLLSLINTDALLLGPESRATLVRLQAVSEHANGEDNDALLEVVSDPNNAEIVRIIAARSVSPRKATQLHVKQLGDLLLGDEKRSLRESIARKLSAIPLPETIPLLMKAVLDTEDPELRSIFAHCVRDAEAAVPWDRKVRQLLNTLESDRYYREQLDFETLKIAISPASDDLKQNRFLLMDYLISRAPAHDERMLGILAGLILASCGQNFKLANQRVSTYARDDQETNDTWKRLSEEINSGLISTILHEELRRNLLEPIEAAHREVQSSWRNVNVSTKRLILARTRIMYLAAIVGVILLGIGGWQLLSSAHWSVALVFGATGLFSLVFSLFSNATTEARQSLIDMGALNVIYSGFIQRMVEVRHYNAKISAEQGPSSDLLVESTLHINEAVQDALTALNSVSDKREMTLDEFIDQYT